MMLLIYYKFIDLAIQITFSLYMQKIYINIFQKTDLIEILKYQIHETNRLLTGYNILKKQQRST